MRKLTLSNLGCNDVISSNTLFFTLEGAVGAIILNLANPFFSMFAKRMGATDYQIGLISSLPALIGILALIPGSLIVDRASNKKKIVSLLILLFGVMYPLAAFTPLLGNYKVSVFIIIISLMNWPFSVFNISWQSFFSDVMSPCFNSAFTKRSKVATFIGTSTSLLAGLLLAYIPKTDGQRILMYQIFFFLSFILAIIQSWFLNKVSSPPSLPIQREVSNISLIKDCLVTLSKHKEFKVFSILSLLWYMSWQMGWPLFFIYQVDVIGINEAWLSYVNVVVGITGVLTYGFWSRIIEKKSAHFVIIIGMLGLSLNAFTIVLVHTRYQLLFQSAINGLTFSGFTLAIFENLIEVTPQKNKTINIAIYTTLINTSLLFSPLIGVWIYKHTSIVFSLVFVGGFRFVVCSLFGIRYLYFKRNGLGTTK